MQIKINLKGTRALIQHNERMANPLNPHARRLKELTAVKKKTFEHIARISSAEGRGCYYETPDGLVAMPTNNVFASFKAAAKTLKLGRQIEKALRFDGQDNPPMLINGKQIKVDDHAKVFENFLIVGVRNQNARIMRTRPIIHEWESEHRFELDEGLLNLGELTQIAEIAGRDFGLCDWRPRYGTYEAKLTNEKS